MRDPIGEALDDAEHQGSDMVGDLELAVANDPSATRHYDFTSGIGDISIRN